jgi:hypothetical protein
MSLKNRISALAEEFSAGVLAAIRSASLEEILAGGSTAPAKRAPGRLPKANGGLTTESAKAAPRTPAPRRKGGRLARRSPEQSGEVIELIVAALKKSKDGMRSEQLQKVLKLDKKEISGPLNEALEGKKISKKGQRRATTYFAR